MGKHQQQPSDGEEDDDYEEDEDMAVMALLWVVVKRFECILQLGCRSVKRQETSAVARRKFRDGCKSFVPNTESTLLVARETLVFVHICRRSSKCDDDDDDMAQDDGRSVIASSAYNGIVSAPFGKSNTITHARRTIPSAILTTTSTTGNFLADSGV